MSFGGDQAKFDEALTQQGITIDQLKQSYKESMLMQKVYDEVTKDVTTVPDADIQAYYDAHKTDYFVEETRTARHILLLRPRVASTGPPPLPRPAPLPRPPPAPRPVPPIRRHDGRLDEHRLLLDNDHGCADRRRLERGSRDRQQGAGCNSSPAPTGRTKRPQYSDDPGSKAKGGDLGTISKGEMVQEFEDAVFSLEKDEISQPVKTAYGYHVIQVTGINEAKQYTLDEVKEDIKTSLVSEAKSKAWRAWIDEQKKAAGVVYADAWAPHHAPRSHRRSAGDHRPPAVLPIPPTTTAGATITTAAPTTTTAKPISAYTQRGALQARGLLSGERRRAGGRNPRPFLSAVSGAGRGPRGRSAFPRSKALTRPSRSGRSAPDR